MQIKFSTKFNKDLKKVSNYPAFEEQIESVNVFKV